MGKTLDDLLDQCHFQQDRAQLSRIAKDAVTDELPYLTFLERVLSAEVTARSDKSMESRVKQAGFPYIRTLESFDFAFQTTVSKRHILQLAHLQWLDDAFNLFFIGPPGTGNYRKYFVMERNERTSFSTKDCTLISFDNTSE